MEQPPSESGDVLGMFELGMCGAAPEWFEWRPKAAVSLDLYGASPRVIRVAA